tara:strand:- start:15144 stop:15467 length:324 start_codon:yes stop_codon:yes gene_type:complete
MPYTEEELRDNLHYQSLKERDEIKYEQKFQKDLSKFLTKEGSTEETKNKILKTSLRDNNGVIRLFENFNNGETYSNLSQKLYIEVYQRRYRTKEDTFDYIDREFKEL